MFCLKIKITISYRIVVALQSISFLLFSKTFHLSYENIYALKLLLKSNIYISSSLSRLSIPTINFIIPVCFMFVGAIILLLSLCLLTKILSQKTYEGYCDYIKDNIWYLMLCFYYFSSRIMAFYIGLWITTLSTNIMDLTTIIVFGVIILVVTLKLLYDFHKGKL